MIVVGHSVPSGIYTLGIYTLPPKFIFSPVFRETERKDILLVMETVK